MTEKNLPLVAVLQLLRKHNLKGTEELLRKEANIGDVDLSHVELPDTELNILSAYHSDGDPSSYEYAYDNFKKFIEASLDIYKHELSTILYPVLVHMYLELIVNGHEEQAFNFLRKYVPEQEDYYQDDLVCLSLVTKKEQMKENEIAENFSSNKFTIQISRDTSSLLKRFLQEQKHSSIIANIVSNHIMLDLYEGTARNREQVRATAGSLMGEAIRHENRTKVYYGLLKEPDIQSIQTVPAEEDDDNEETPDKPKKKKSKKDPIFSKKAKSDPNAPPADRMPLPDLKETDKLEKFRALREATKRISLGIDSLPSVCFYTLLNANQAATCADICDDSSLLAVGFSHSAIKVCSLTPLKLKTMKSAEKLQDIDREADDVLARMMDEQSGDMVRTLHGHSGPVYKVSFDPYKSLLLSCSEDSTIRLWSLHTWSCVVVYRGHVFAVWDVQFSPHGHYFASAGHDRTARLWATDNHQPLRLFAGHLSDVDCMQFHPNSNYIATGSSDRTIRVWDCVSGNQVRIMTGHKAPVYALAFSNCGRWLASGAGSGSGCDGAILLWDISTGVLAVRLMNAHSGPIHSLAFSRDCNMLASGSLDCTLKLWDFVAMTEDALGEEGNLSLASGSNVNKEDRHLLRSLGTKNAPVTCLHFTRRNLLLGVGIYE